MNDKHIAQKTWSYSECYEVLAATFDKDFALIKAFEQNCPEGPVLNIGAGCGRILGCEISKPLILVEPDEGMLFILRQRITQLRSEAIVAQGSSVQLPLADESVAGVFFCYNDLAEMSPILFSLQEAARVLQPGGKLLLTMHNPLHRGGYCQGTRKISLNGEVYTYHVDTVPSSSLYGPFGFATTFSFRGNGFRRDFSIQQTFPSIEFFKKMVAICGLEVRGSFSSFSTNAFQHQNEMPAIFSLVCEKTGTNSGVKVPASELASFYDGMAEKYDQVTQKFSYSVPAWLRRELIALSGMNLRVLDIGSGNGLVGKILKENEVLGDLFGIDFSGEMVSKTRATGLYKGVLQYDLSDGMPFPEEGLFDAIFACGVLEFVPHLPARLDEIRKLLVLGGRAWFTLEKTMSGSLPSGTYDPLGHCQRWHFSEKEIRTLISRAGLSVVSMESGPAFVAVNSGRQVHYHFIQVKRDSI